MSDTAIRNASVVVKETSQIANFLAYSRYHLGRTRNSERTTEI